MNVSGVGSFTYCSNFCGSVRKIPKKIIPIEIIVPDSITFKLPIHPQPENRLPVYEIPPEYFPIKPNQKPERGSNIEPMNPNSYSIIDYGKVDFPILKM